MRFQPNLELRDLRLVQAIFSERTTAAAAKVLGMTQSGVSHQLRHLEERLGGEVFERRGRSLHITETGQRMIALGREILDSVASLESELGRGTSAPPTLRVATQCYTAYSWLPVATVEMKRRGHELRIKPVVPRAKNLHQALLEDEVDLALTIGADKELRVCQRRLFSDELVLVTARDHPLARRSFVSGSDLHDLELLLLDSTRDESGRVRRELFPQGGGFRSVSYLPITEAIVEMVKAGLGVSVLTSWAAAASAERGDVACVRLNHRGLKREWVGAYRRSGPLVAPARELLSILKESYQAGSGPQMI